MADLLKNYNDDEDCECEDQYDEPDSYLVDELYEHNFLCFYSRLGPQKPELDQLLIEVSGPRKMSSMQV